MTRAVYLVHSAQPSGAELSLVRKLQGAKLSQPEVVLAANGELADLLRAAEVNVSVLPGPAGAMAVKRTGGSLTGRLRGMLALLGYGWRLGQHLRVRRADVVVATSIKALVYGTVAARRAGVPLIWSVHDRVARDYLGAAAVLVRLLGRFSPTAYIVNSQTTLSTVRTGAKPVLVLPPSVRLPSRVPGRDRSADPCVRLVVVGRFAHWKGQDIFVKAFQEALADSSAEAVVVGGPLFGEDDYYRSVRQLALEGATKVRIRFTGHVPDASSYIANADVLVHASRLPEPLGAVVIEGMAHGCAVIATEPGGPAEVITSGIDGLLVACGDVVALGQAMLLLVQDGALRLRLGEAGRRRAEDFAVSTIAPIAEDFVNGVGAGRRLPARVESVRLNPRHR